MSAAEVAIDSMSKAGAMPCTAPSGTATCPEGRIRMGVFFDGTGNNQWRDWPHGVAQTPNPKGKFTGPTNVAKLWRLYIDIGDIQKRVYHHGPGTDSDGTDAAKKLPQNQQPTDSNGRLDEGTDDTSFDWRGMLFGAGGKARTTWGLKHLSEFFSKNNNPLAKEKLVDVYGFSRGAAIGRDFINRALLEGVDNLKDKSGFRYVTMPSGGRGGVTTVRVPAYVRHQHVIFNFLGAFDTVASFGLGGKQMGNDLAGYNFFINHNDVRHTVHMVAEDEVRSLFPVSSLFMDPKLAGSQNPSDYKSTMVELWYPGAHSDVGGSYLPIPMVPGKPARTDYIYTDFGATPYEVAAVAPTPPIQPELAHIPLRDMHKASVDQGVPLKPLSAMGPAHLWTIPGELLSQYNAYSGYRQGTPYGIGKRYIQNFIVETYLPMFAARAVQPSVASLRINYMHDTRMFLDKGKKHKRTVLYMGPQPATKPKDG